MKYLKTLEIRDPDRVNDKQIAAEFKAYRQNLQTLRSRLSSQAWDYFWNGFAETSIHDARLVALTLGDGFSGDRGKRGKLKVKLEFLSQTNKYRFEFQYTQIKTIAITFDATAGQTFFLLPGGQKIHDKSYYVNCNELDDVTGDELTPADDKHMRHEIIFTSGARIIVEALRITFQRKRNAV